ncbi:MAG: hypothetical protein Q8P02_02460 [Candidatus Micrarchaeota archaeon]|nr:hypothetical protein [Candidatus Micrarchaeota archaeon]
MHATLPKRYTPRLQELKNREIPFEIRHHESLGAHIVIDVRGHEGKIRDMVAQTARHAWEQQRPIPPMAKRTSNFFERLFAKKAGPESAARPAPAPSDEGISQLLPEVQKIQGRNVSPARLWQAHLQDWAALASGDRNARTVPAGKDPRRDAVIAIQLPE